MAPLSGYVEENERFWSDIGRVLGRVGNMYRLCVLGDLNGWVGDKMKVGITGAFGVPGYNDNGRRVTYICAEIGLCVGNTSFDHKSLQKYTRVARHQDRVEIMSIIDLVIMKKDILRYAQDVKGVRGIRRGLSDYYVVQSKDRLMDT